MIRFTKQITTEEYMELRRKVGWMEFPAEEAAACVQNAYYVLCVRVAYHYTPEKAEMTFAADNALDDSWSYRYQEIPKAQYVSPTSDTSNVSSFLFRGLPTTQIEDGDRFILWWVDNDKTICIVESQRRSWTEVMEFVHLVMCSPVPSY